MLRSMEAFCEDVSSVEFRKDMFQEDYLFACLILDPMVIVVDMFGTIGDLIGRIDCPEC